MAKVTLQLHAVLKVVAVVIVVVVWKPIKTNVKILLKKTKMAVLF